MERIFSDKDHGPETWQNADSCTENLVFSNKTYKSIEKGIGGIILWWIYFRKPSVGKNNFIAYLKIFMQLK